MSRFRITLVVALAAVVGLVLALVVLVDPPARAPETASSRAPDSFVQADGRQFAIDGQRFGFVGVNIYDAAASDSYSCNPGTRLNGADLENTLRALRDRSGATVLRFWAYQTYTDGGTDFAHVDRVLQAARAVGMRVLPVLEDGPGNCTTGNDGDAKSQLEGDTYYTEGYRKPYGSARLSLRDYARVMAEHYRDDPTILGWSMVNEAETTRRTSDGRSVLVDFATDLAGVLHAADPNHLVTVGTQSNGAPGASGRDFTEVYSAPGIDFSEVHDWGSYGSDTEAMPGGDGPTPPDAGSGQCESSSAKIGCSFALAQRIGTPLVVGEAGIEARDADARTRRADLFRAKIDAAFAAGAAGYLIWSVTTSITDGYDVQLTDDDPLLGVLAAQAAELR